jgi:hypothetical protein
MTTGANPPNPAALPAPLEGAAEAPDAEEPDGRVPDCDPEATAEKDWLVGVTACPV